MNEVISALRNSGIDVECGACMEVAFTGVTTNAHTCKKTAPHVFVAFPDFLPLSAQRVYWQTVHDQQNGNTPEYREAVARIAALDAALEGDK